MPVVSCTCGKRFNVGANLAGKRVRCKACNNTFEIPAEPPQVEAIVPLEPAGGDADFANDPIFGGPSESGGEDAFPPSDSAGGIDFNDPLLATMDNAARASSQPTASTAPQSVKGRADGFSYEILGSEMQYLIVTLQPGETTVAEAGAMMFMTPGIQMDTVLGDPSHQKRGLFNQVASAGKRMFTGESLFVTTFSNVGGGRERVAFGAPYPGKILPIHLSRYGGQLIVQKGAFLCGSYGTRVEIALQKKLGVGLFGGEGFIMQRLTGNGVAMIHGGGSMYHATLAEGESLKLDTGCLMALGSSVQYDVEFVGGVKNAFFGGEGLFLATLTGPGPIWCQSLPFSRLAGRLAANASSGGGKGEGSLLGSIGGALGDAVLGD